MWRSPPMRLVRNDQGQRLAESDSPWLGSHALIFRRQTLGELEAMLLSYGELLPVACSEADLVIPEFSTPWTSKLRASRASVAVGSCASRATRSVPMSSRASTSSGSPIFVQLDVCERALRRARQGSRPARLGLQKGVVWMTLRPPPRPRPLAATVPWRRVRHSSERGFAERSHGRDRLGEAAVIVARKGRCLRICPTAERCLLSEDSAQETRVIAPARPRHESAPRDCVLPATGT
jgi:hypothetical protein